ncbi:MAG: AI-2E family transporter [Rhodobacteraceae bacterium]|nr:AI-2E family transporter [Paracoccaceae bacterium]
MPLPVTSGGMSLRWLALLTATILISVIFFQIIAPFVVPLLLAAIAAAMMSPFNKRLCRMLGGRKSLASVLTLVFLAVAILGPLFALIYLAAIQAAGLTDTVRDTAQNLSDSQLSDFLPTWFPYESEIEKLWPKIVQKVGEFTHAAANFFVSILPAVTRGAANLFLSLFIFIYALFFYLQMEPSIMVRVLRYSGLQNPVQEQLIDRVISISRATLKGTLFIGVIQGVLGGISLWVVGVSGFAFWSVVMMVFSVIPGLGAPSVLVGAAIFLASQGDWTSAIGLALWAVVVVGTIDNLLRPILVGRDAKLHDVMILVSSLGGLGTFGITGLVLGPVLAGLFVSIWSTLSDNIDISARNEETDALSQSNGPRD